MASFEIIVVETSTKRYTVNAENEYDARDQWTKSPGLDADEETSCTYEVVAVVER